MSAEEKFDGAEAHIIAAVDTFKTLAQIPSVSSGELRRGDKHESHDIELVLSNRSYSTLTRRTQRCHISIRFGKVASTSFTPAIETSEDPIKARFSSLPGSSSNWTVILRECNNKKVIEKRRFVELWRGDRCYKSADVTKHHGAFTTNDTFGSFSIHDDVVLYSAEANLPSKEIDLASRKHKDGLQDWEYRAPLGEKFGGQVEPSVFLIQFNTKSKEDVRLCRLTAADDEKDPSISTALFGQAVFSLSGKEIYLTAYPTLLDGRRLGIIYCSNRPAVIFKASIDLSAGGSVKDADAVKRSSWRPSCWSRLSPSGFSGRSPRAKSDGGCVWLQAQQSGAHDDCNTLMSCDGQGQITEEIPMMDSSDAESRFPGLFATNLKRSCALADSTIVLDTIWGSSRAIIVHQLGSKSMPVAASAIQGQNRSPWSYSFLCSDGEDTILATRSTPLHPQQVVLGKVSSNATEIEWLIVYDAATQWEEEEAMQKLERLQFSVEETPPIQSHRKDDVLVQSVIVEDKASRPHPAILLLHGGPHSASTTDWSPSNAALCLQGYSIIMPNYHGSLGRGQKFVHSLLGQCGCLDVQDCKASIQRLVDQGRVDKRRLNVQGGSHGGFLTTHLIGQCPDMFQSAIARNPVIAAGIMEGTTDIPDWCYAEFGQSFPFDDAAKLPHYLTSQQYEELQRRSPVYHIDRIKTPLLLLLGLSDQRVPPSQSKLIYHRLKAISKEVRMLSFEDQDHALDGVECELICWEASMRWLR